MTDATAQKGKMWKKYLIVFLLTFSWIVYLIPYLATDFYNQFLEAYGLTDGQLGKVITFFGLTATPGYFISGWFAGRFNAKKLMVLSCVLTAAVSIGIAMTHSYIIGLAIAFVVPFDPQKAVGEEDTIKLAHLGKALKMPITYYLGLFTLGFYLIRCIIPYVNPHLTASFGISVTFATAFTMTARTGVKMFSGSFGGSLRDKIGKSTPVVTIGAVGAIVFSLVMAFIPGKESLAIPFMLMALVVVFFSGMNSPMLYTPVSEAKIPLKYTGTILGIASAIGYSADIWLYSLCGGWLDKFGNDAYRYIYILMAFGGVLMLVMGLLLKTCYPKNEAESKAAALKMEV